MIDIHCHILPGVDDGPSRMEESIEMCRIAASDGISTIVATPHFRFGDTVDSIASRRKTLELLHNELRSRDIHVRILTGADISVTPELGTYLRNHPELTINETGRYFLAELPHDAVPRQWDMFLLTVKRNGITPILTHPERNPWFIAHPQILYPYVRGGGLVQITAQSVTGGLGKQVRDCSHFLLKNNLVQVIASDAHSIKLRPPLLSGAVKIAANILGETAANKLVRDFPGAIIKGEPFDFPEPVSENIPRKKKWYQRILDI